MLGQKILGPKNLSKIFLKEIGLSGVGEMDRGSSRRVKVYSLFLELPLYQTRLISILSKKI